MNKLAPWLILLGLLLTGLPAAAQFRTEMQAAGKEMELRAYHLAIRSYQRALHLRPDDHEAQAALAEAYRMTNQLDSARIYYAQAMQDRKVSAFTLLGYAQTLHGLGMYEGAQLLYQAFAREEDAVVGNHFVTSCTFAQQQLEETAGFVAKQLSIATEQPEYGASVPQEGKLLFNSGRMDPGMPGMVMDRPYLAKMAPDGSLGEPSVLATGYIPTDGSHMGPIHYSPDGRRVVFTRNNFTVGTRPIPEAGPTLSLMVADVNGEGMWSNVRPLPFNGSDYSTGYGTFGNDGTTIYFASNRPGGYGGYDIYRAALNGDDWEKTPENLGPVVNSRGHEITPFYDGHSLYFSSSYHHGMGGYDVFRAQTATGKPLALFHMGSEVNSSRDDFGFAFDRSSRTGYVTSNRTGFTGGMEDIYYVITETEQSAIDALAQPGTGVAPDGPAAPTLSGVIPVKPPTLTTMRGYLTDLETQRPVPDADVMVSTKSTGQEAVSWSDSYGAFYASVEPFTNYEVSVSAPGYEDMVFDVTTGDVEQTEVFGTTPLQPTGGDAVVETAAAPAPRPTSGNYLVQIASMLREPRPDEFAEVAQLGQLDVNREGNRRRIRFGYFATRSEASAAALRARQAGYAGSFVVERAPTTPAPSPAVAATPAPLSSTAKFRVQLGAFGRPENFDRAKAAQLGELASESRGTLTVFYIDNIDTLDGAEYIRDLAVDLGFIGPYVLERTAGGYTKR